MMKVFEFIEVVARFHQYVMRGNTGDSSSFAQKLGISRATLFRLINELSDYGIHIYYSREQESYRYKSPELVEIHISICEHEQIKEE